MLNHDILNITLNEKFLFPKCLYCDNIKNHNAKKYWVIYFIKNDFNIFDLLNFSLL
jgi:hypothetical protein